ncbi:alpha/beta-hydrolase [Saccharata proteae CBS 121410]|uniref:Alpha/beta-hydrolase n=1 Tax=Saccharata proteae CBS 121410 TaxID=1314787 RepID=A0A9P4HQC3_9PEZI|nr:alpha/beta-hydrolase [Saccharata proteae CBS 121410]
MTDEIKPFDPIGSISNDEVERMYRKLRDTRLPTSPIVPDAGEDYGAPLDWAHRLYNLWANEYDWNVAAKEISSWHHYKTTLENLDIHFLHERADVSKDTKAIPLLLVHGWPGSFYEFSRVIKPLTHPNFADVPTFNVVVPSLPGFCWSQAGPRGWTLQDTARIFDALMQRLGYTSYVAQGGDWGHWVVRELGARYNACKAVHTNMCPSEPPPATAPNAREKMAEERMKWFIGRPGMETHMGYAIEMRTRPQTLGIALSDNPVGIMMWIGEKYNEITDPNLGGLQDAEFNNRLITTLCLYFFTSPSVMTSMLCYYENVRHEDYNEFNLRQENYITCPMGFSSFRWDISPTSERAVARTGNLKWYKGTFQCFCADYFVSVC